MQRNLEELEPSQDISLYKITPFIALLVSAIAGGTTPIFINISLHEMGVNPTMFNRLWISSVIFIVLTLFKKNSERLKQESVEEPVEKPNVQRIDRVYLLILSVVYITGRFLWTFALSKTTVTNGSIISCLEPFITMVGAWLFFNKTFGAKSFIGLAIAFLGSLTLELNELQKLDIHLMGDSLTILSSIFYASGILMIKKISGKFSSSEILLWRCSVGTISFLPIMLLFEEHIFPTSLLGWFAVIAMALVGEMLAHGLMVYCLKLFSASFVSLSTLLTPIVTVILAWSILAEQLYNFTWLALGLVVLGVYISKETPAKS